MPHEEVHLRAEFDWIRHLLYTVLTNQERQIKNQEREMAAIDDLQANVAKLSADVDALLAKPMGVPEAQVQAQADAVAAVDAKVVQALG